MGGGPGKVRYNTRSGKIRYGCPRAEREGGGVIQNSWQLEFRAAAILSDVCRRIAPPKGGGPPLDGVVSAERSRYTTYFAFAGKKLFRVRLEVNGRTLSVAKKL